MKIQEKPINVARDETVKQQNETLWESESGQQNNFNARTTKHEECGDNKKSQTINLSKCTQNIVFNIFHLIA